MGNCKSCIKPRTSDDLERPSRQSISDQRPSGAEGGLDFRSESSVGRVPSAASRRSTNGSSKRNGSSKSIKSITRGNQPLHPCQNQEVPPPLNEDGKDLNRRLSSTTRQRIVNSGSAVNKENVILVRPAESDVYTNEGRNLMNKLKTQHPINNVKDICFILWEKDERLVHNNHYKFSRNNGLQVNLKESYYAEHPTYKAFRELLTIYSSADMNTNRRESVEDEFLEQVMEKEVMQICWAFLNHSGYFPSDRNTFKNALRAIWFPHAFRHIFAGVEDEDRVSGLHNWLQFSLEKKNIEYLRCWKQIPEIMVHIRYRWRGVLKEYGSMFLGTSPEFELALYTLLFFETLRERNKSVEEVTYELNLGGRHAYDETNILVQVVVDTFNNRKTLKTAYPIKPKTN